METCYRHPSRETGVACSSCGRPICPDCMTPTPVGMRCPECAQQRTAVRTAKTLTADPAVTVALIGINAIAFLAEVTSGHGLGFTQAGRVFREGALFGPAIDGQHEYYRLVSSAFLHAGVLHIAFNMYLLWILGQMLEPAIGHLRFGVIYFVSLLAGSFGALVQAPNAATVGASGAVFGLMGAALVILRARGFNPMASGIPLLIGINLIFGFAVSGIAWGGHIGGLIGGILAAYAIVEVGERRGSNLGALAACVLLGTVSVVGAIAVA